MNNTETTATGPTLADLKGIVKRFRDMPPVLTKIEVNAKAYAMLMNSLAKQPVTQGPEIPPFAGVGVAVDAELNAEPYPCGVMTFSDGRKEKTDFAQKSPPTLPLIAAEMFAFIAGGGE